MSHNGRIVLYVAAFVLCIIAAVTDIVQSKRVTCLALIAAALAVDNLIWLNDAT